MILCRTVGSQVREYLLRRLATCKAQIRVCLIAHDCLLFRFDVVDSSAIEVKQ